MHCSVLAEQAVRSAVDDYLRKTTGKGLDLKSDEQLHDHELAEA
jgi:nitrogen fixation NifU-like protein